MSPTRPILVTGKNGQVGYELERLLPALGAVVALDRTELDLSIPDEIRRVIRTVQPRLIVNAAAYTAVDQAESDLTTAHAINAQAPGVMAEEAKRIGALLVHYSTDYVFDGLKNSPYHEEDPKNPLSVYGTTKLAGEEAIRQPRIASDFSDSLGLLDAWPKLLAYSSSPCLSKRGIADRE